ncbi:Complex1 LYR domain containing protein [Trichuris trichiura]|uniref:Complex1 LYR domain containing protein n=1 Tax=Trichuris trichiura TaxID=36087 RepID=A0A077Z2G2_TRITR|nr:Complex1 LYR domain containing protein [Trichuris trichiura]
MGSELTRSAWRTLYKDLIRSANRLSNYSNRQFFLRRIRDHFRRGREETDPLVKEQLYKKGQEALKFLSREESIEVNNKAPRLVIEH